MFLEPLKELVDGRKHLAPVSKPVHGNSDVLVLCSGARHVGEQEFTLR